VGLERVTLKSAIIGCLGAPTLCSGCMIFDDDFIEDEPHSYLTAPHSHPAR